MHRCMYGQTQTLHPPLPPNLTDTFNCRPHCTTTLAITLSSSKFILVLHVGFFPSIIHFFVWIFTRDYVFALWKCPWLLFIMWFHESDSFKFMCNLAWVEALQSGKLEQTQTRACTCCEHVCIFLKLQQSRTSISGRECAATVDGVSERVNYSCVICFSSRLKHPNQPTLLVTAKKKN